MTTKRISYWDGNATYSKWMDENYPLLVKPSGPSDTVEGELIRAVSRLNHDWGNNGMCNNTSGACHFIKRYVDFTDEEYSAWQEVYSESNTGGYTTHENLIGHITTVSDAVIKYVISREGNYSPLTKDMLEFADDDYDVGDDECSGCGEREYYCHCEEYHED
jgi:hypothetical protein